MAMPIIWTITPVTTCEMSYGHLVTKDGAPVTTFDSMFATDTGDYSITQQTDRTLDGTYVVKVWPITPASVSLEATQPITFNLEIVDPCEDPELTVIVTPITT